MKRKIFLPMIGLGIVCLCNAQSLSPSILSSSGGINKGTSIQLEWTLGEVAISSLPTSNGLITEGFHQPILKVESVSDPIELPVHHSVDEELKILVGPNPLKSILSISIESNEDNQGMVYLMDQNGRRLQKLDVSLLSENLEWDLSPFPAGFYWLSFYSKEGQLLRSFKITKAE